MSEIYSTFKTSVDKMTMGLPTSRSFSFISPAFLPSGNHQFILYEFDSVLLHLFVLFFRFHIKVKSYDTSFSLSYFT